MRTKPYIFTTLAVLLLGFEAGIAQTEPLPPPEIPSSPLPSPEPPPILPAQQETIKQLIDTEIKESQALVDRVDDEVSDAFGITMGLLNLLITMLIALPIGAGFVFWWLRQSVIDRLVTDIRHQFQKETEQIVRQQLEQEVTTRLQKQIEDFEQELQQLREDFEQRLDHLYQDAENNKDHIVLELEQLLATIGQDEVVPLSVERRLKELTDQLESIKAASANISFSASDYLKEGDAFYLRRDYENAVTSYKEALVINPDLIDAWHGLAKTLRRMGRYSEAVTTNEEIIQRQPENAWGWFGKGFALSDMQQYEASLNAYDTAIQLAPNHSTFWKHRGYVLTKLKRYDEALDCFEKTLHLKPQSSGAYYWRACCHATQGQVELAIEYLKEAICRSSDYRNRARLDPDFDPIRKTEAFQHLVSASAE